MTYMDGDTREHELGNRPCVIDCSIPIKNEKSQEGGELGLTILFSVSSSVDSYVKSHEALFCYSWVTSLMCKGFKHELKHEDLFAPPEESLSRDLHQRFDKLVLICLTRLVR